MKLSAPFIQLPLLYDAPRLAAEIEALGEGVWRDHPAKFPGNSMLPLVAANGNPADERFAGRMAPTPELEACPYLMQVMESLGATLGRSRLMRLEGQAEVTPHTDQGYYWAERVRIHVPIVTQPTVRFECGDAAIHMAEGECWIFDTWRNHRVLNDSNMRRIHLVADTVGGGRFWQNVERGRKHDTPNPAFAPTLIPFDPARRAQLACEKFNLPKVMSPWEIRCHFEDLFNDTPEQPGRAEALAQSLQFTRDWHGLWSEYGDSGEGVPKYRDALQRFLDALPADVDRILMKNQTQWFTGMAAWIAKPAIGL